MPMEFHRPITEEIEDTKLKILLLKGDKKAYYESSNQALEDCKKRVVELRKENSRFRLQLKEKLIADDHVIAQAFQNKPIERTMFANKSITIAKTTMDLKVCDKNKNLNALKYVSNVKQRRIAELQSIYNELLGDSIHAEDTLSGRNLDGQKLRDLENRLDKAKLKCGEAEYIKKTYETIKGRLEEEHMNYGNRLDLMEKEINRCRQELIGLNVIQEDAALARDGSVLELKRQEDMVFSERRRRDLELISMRKVAQDKRITQEKVEKRLIVRDSVSMLEESEDFDGSMTEEQHRRMNEYESTFKTLTEVSGICILDEMVKKFEEQGQTMFHLESLKVVAENTISKLQERIKQLKLDHDEIKLTKQNTLADSQMILGFYEDEIEKKEITRVTVYENFRSNYQNLMKCKSGIEHLYDKLRHIKVYNDDEYYSPIDMFTDDFVLDILSEVEERVEQMMLDFGRRNITKKIATMHYYENSEFLNLSEFHDEIEYKMSVHNARIVLPPLKKDNIYEVNNTDDDDSGDDDAEVLTREDIKKQSQILVDTKNKSRRIPKKKKKSKAK